MPDPYGAGQSVRLHLPISISHFIGPVAEPSLRVDTSMNETASSAAIQARQVYLIDVVNQRVNPVPYDGSLNRLYELIECDLVDSTARKPNGDGIFCTDMLPDEPYLPAFRLRSTQQIIYGNGVWAGCDDEGETVSPATPLEQVRGEVEFLGITPYRPMPIIVIAW